MSKLAPVSGAENKLAAELEQVSHSVSQREVARSTRNASDGLNWEWRLVVRFAIRAQVSEARTAQGHSGN